MYELIGPQSSVCQQEFAGPKSCTRHLKEMHKTSIKVYRCPVCDSVSQRRASARRHIARRHRASTGEPIETVMLRTEFETQKLKDDEKKEKAKQEKVAAAAAAAALSDTDSENDMSSDSSPAVSDSDSGASVTDRTRSKTLRKRAFEDETTDDQAEP